MSVKPPLQLILARVEADKEGVPFQEAAERAFKGGSFIGGYLAGGDDLGVETKSFSNAPSGLEPSRLLDAACHTVFVPIIGNEGLKDDQFLNWVTDCWSQVQASDRRHSFILLALEEGVGERLRNVRQGLGDVQCLAPQQLGETAIRCGYFGLRVLQEARRVIAPQVADSSTEAFLRIFISHAKLDGLPLAQALKHQIETTVWLSSFYDARDLTQESDWKAALREADCSSVLVILRTDAYEQRFWCRQEVLWAEQVAAPTVLVDARPGLAYPGCDLGLERMPYVRIPDGNLVRVLYAAVREGLRYLLFQRRVQELRAAGYIPNTSLLRTFSYAPSMLALLTACTEIRASAEYQMDKTATILYPDPPLRTGAYEAANALVNQLVPGVFLGTPATAVARSTQ